MFDRFREARDQPSELNLIPIMNLMITLIPFLMLGAAFYHLGVIPTSLPDKVEAVSKPPKDAAVSLNLVIEPEQMVLTANSNAVPQDALDAMRRALPVTDKGHDLVALQAHLLAIKTEYPKSDTIVLLPDAQLRYETLVAVLDAARERKLENGEFAPLFPVTVFSERILAEPDAGLEEAPPEEPTP